MAIHEPPGRQSTRPKPVPGGPAAPIDRAVVGASDDGDLALIPRIAANDLAALAALYDRYRGAAFGLALRITRDHSLAEDVVQDAFLGVWRGASRYDPRRGGSRTWIMTIVHHRAVDVVRRRRPVVELPTFEASAPAGLVTPDVWAEVARHLDREAIVGALADLGPAQREAIQLAYFSGLTQTEIARPHGRAPGDRQESCAPRFVSPSRRHCPRQQRSVGCAQRGALGCDRPSGLSRLRFSGFDALRGSA